MIAMVNLAIINMDQLKDVIKFQKILPADLKLKLASKALLIPRGYNDKCRSRKISEIEY
jgi:hypothetical protein